MSQLYENVIPPVFFPPLIMPFYKGVPPIQESFIVASAKPGRSVFLAPNPLDPLRLYHHNVTNAESG